MARFASLARIVPASAATLLALGMLAAPTGASADFQLPKCFPHCGQGPTLNKDFLNKYSKYYGNKYGYGSGPKYGYGGGYKYGGGNGGGWGYGAAALGGMAVGLVAAGAASANAQGSEYVGECALVRRRAFDEDGNMYIRRVRVCE